MNLQRDNFTGRFQAKVSWQTPVTVANQKLFMIRTNKIQSFPAGRHQKKQDDNIRLELSSVTLSRIRANNPR